MPKKYINANQIQWHSNWLISKDPRVFAYMDEIDNIPAANVEEVRRGKWIKDENNGYFKCSNCGSTKPYDGISEENPDNVAYWVCKYCPNCGAKMF